MQPDSSDRDAISATMHRLKGIFGNLQEVAARIAQSMSDVMATEGVDVEHLRLSDSARALLQREIVATLGRARWCDGAGYANYRPPSGISPHAARPDGTTQLDENGYWTLEWWISDIDGVRPVPLESDQGRQRRVDFRTFNWFREPASHRKAYVEGPYVDYVCNGSYTITAAHPVVVGGHFAGVGVADILVSTLEREMSPLLHRLPGPAVIANPEGRVVISTAPSIRPGTLWAQDERWQVVDSPVHPFRLAISSATELQ